MKTKQNKFAEQNYLFTDAHKENWICINEGVVSKETVVLRRWGSSIQKFGFINGVDNVNWPPYRDSKSWICIVCNINLFVREFLINRASRISMQRIKKEKKWTEQ